MNFVFDNFFSIVSLAITIFGFVFTMGGFYSKINSLQSDLQERRKMVNKKIHEIEHRVLAMEKRTTDWAVLEERISYIKENLEKLLVRFEKLFEQKTKK